MNPAMSNFATKVGKWLLNLIVDYLSSEEFTNKVKLLVEQMVERIVAIVICERKNDV
ncbi:MAG: hypothetical protein ACK5NA_01160 [Enterococcus sp.]